MLTEYMQCEKLKMLKPIRITIFVFFLHLGLSLSLRAQTHEVVSLSDSIGPVIDSLEKQTYHLFPEVKEFQKGQIVRLSESKFRLDYGYQDLAGTHFVSRKLSKEAVELTQFHAKLCEDYRVLSKIESRTPDVEANLLYKLALRYASETRYDFAATLISHLVEFYPETPQAKEAERLQSSIFKIAKTRKALIFKGSLLDHSGRTELLIFSGYYGLWLGIATPISLEANSPQAFSLGLLLGGPASLWIAHEMTKDANVSDAKATIISLGGHLGTWQGIGWAVVADQEAVNVIRLGEVSGLLGIAAAAHLSNRIEFSEGHAALTSSGLEWGAWFGLVFGAIAEHEGDDLLRDMLLGTDIAILGTGILTKGVKMSQARVRFINLCGVFGTVAGFGIDLMVEAQESSTIFAIAGAGSVAGLAAGANLTKNYDKDRELSQSNFEFPKFSFVQNPNNKKELIPVIGFQLKF